MRLANLGEADARRGMRMHDSAEIGSRRVGASMDPQLAVRDALAGEHGAVRVEDKETVLFGESGRSAGGHQECLGSGNARACVSEHGREPATLENAVGERNVAA